MKDYFLRRFLRIAPLYYLVITIVFIYQQTNGQVNTEYLHIGDGRSGFFRHLMFYQGDSVFWTMPVEMQFYVLLPLLVFSVNKFQAKGLFGLGLVAGGYFLYYISSRFSLPSGDHFIALNVNGRSSFFDVFICGIVAAYLLQDRRATSFYARNKSLLDKSIAILFPIMCFLTVIFISKSSFLFSRGNLISFGYQFRELSLLYGIAWSLILWSVLLDNPFLRPILDQQWLRIIGITGFSWYLLHLFVIQVVNHAFTSMQEEVGIFRMAVSFTLCFIVSGLTYLIIEKPFMNLGRYLQSAFSTP